MPPIDPTTGFVFDIRAQFRFLMDQIYVVVLWLQSHFLYFADGFVISYYELFFDIWAVYLILSWIPVIGDMIRSTDDADDFELDYF